PGFRDHRHLHSFPTRRSSDLNGILRNAETGSILQESPLMDSAVFLITILFFIPGLVYGALIKNLDGTRGFAKMLGDSMSSMGQYIVLVFFAEQMLAYFEWSNLGPIIAIYGSDRKSVV